MNLYDILCSDNVVESINYNIDYLLTIIPEINYMIGFEHNNPHNPLDVWNHTLKALSYSKNDFNLRLILLLHDIGKRFSYQEHNGIRSFIGHPDKSAEIAYNILKRLGFDEKYIKNICFYIKNHDKRITSELIKEDYNKALLLYEVQVCDAMAHSTEAYEKKKIYLRKIDDKLHQIN